MKDFLGRELKVGDTVVFLTHCKTSSSLHKGVIKSFSPQKAYVVGDYHSTYKSPDKIVKVGTDNAET